jgi:predicted GNAT family acetyltransferase
VEKAVLFANNPAAVKSYEEIGFKKIGTYRLALLKQSATKR